MVDEERRNNDEQSEEKHEQQQLYKTKIVQFLGRTTPIILQNDNGPCPLLAICNVLLLKNNLNISVDESEVPLDRLLSSVAERLIDSNSNTENKDAGYVENQQKNIGDAIDLLPRLATGIDVNLQFRRIGDFEFTRECAIFDLLDIPLYHGWIVDPQDLHTAIAIGSKSYNTLMGELVALETISTEERNNTNVEGDCIDFAAATTATLGVPSPCLSRARSFDDSPHSECSVQRSRKGDIEEEAELLKVLQLSNAEATTSFDESVPGDANWKDLSSCSDESTYLKSFETEVITDNLEVHPAGHQQFYQLEQSLALATDASSSSISARQNLETDLLETERSDSKVSSESYLDQSSREPAEHFICNDIKEHIGSLALVQNQTQTSSNIEDHSLTAYENDKDGPSEDQQIHETCLQASTSTVPLELEDNERGSDETVVAGTSASNRDPDLSAGMEVHIDSPKGDTSSLDGSEPIYEGEDRILDTGLVSYESREPMYEGEVVLAEQAERSSCEVHPQSDMNQHNGELVRNFLRINASQLTIYGLFCLQEGLKERELCVFFRNNHFSTLFKYNGELYLLATDQGYLNQPDLVWEKLNEVNGDTVFMTGNFTEFKVDNHTNDTLWDQQNAMAHTADYLASIDTAAEMDSTLNSDMQLAMALQQQEFDNQPQRSQNSQRPSSGGNSRLVTGPQVQRSNPSQSSPKRDSKKDKCTLM